MVKNQLNEDIAKMVIGRYDKLYADQANWRSLWQDLADFIHPRKSSSIISQGSPGGSQTERLFDSTAIHANELLAASMSSALTSGATKWFSLKIRGLDNEDKEVSEWLEMCSTRMYKAIQQSNFNSEIHEGYLDLGAFGTSALEITERVIEVPGFNGLHFKSYNIGEYVFAENFEGRVDTIIRKITMTVRAAHNQWGKLLGKDLVKKAQDRPDDDIEILHAVMPASDIGNINVKSAYKFVSGNIDYRTKKIIKVGGFMEFPICVVRWAKSSGEVPGRGPGFTALPDIKTLNKAVELGLKAWAKAIDPPLEVVDDGVIGLIRLQPSGITYVREKGMVNPMQFGARFDVSKIEQEDLRTSIRRIFFSDQLQFQQTPQMTATEVYVRYELMQRLLGPTLGRLEAELLNPMIERIFNMMLRAGVFGDVPSGLKGKKIDIEYEGPMARAQRSGEMVAIQRTYEIIAPLAQSNPEILDHFDVDKIPEFAAKITGMPTILLRSAADIKKIRDARAKQAAANQQKADLAAIAEGAGKIAPLIGAIKPEVPTAGGGQ